MQSIQPQKVTPVLQGTGVSPVVMLLSAHGFAQAEHTQLGGGQFRTFLKMELHIFLNSQ